MSQQPDSSPRITRRLETPPVEPATTPGDGKAGPRETPMPDDGGLLGQIAEWYDADNTRMAQQSRDRSIRMSDTQQAAATTPGDGKAGQQDTATGYVIGRLTPAADGMPPRFVLHHATVYPTEEDARSFLYACFLDYGDWRIYTLTDITERPTDE